VELHTFARSRPVRIVRNALLVLVALVVLQLARVEHSTGEARLWPSAAPPRLQELGRTYRRSDSALPMRAPYGVRAAGTTPGGGHLFAPRLTAFQVRAQAVPTVLWVRDHSGRLWTYALSGGP
jgi:hypothetical protein